MSQSARNSRILDAAFLAFGEDAAWEGVPERVRVRRREEDEPAPLTYASAIVTGRRIRVRKSEVPEPVVGQTIQIVDEAGEPVTNGAFVVSGDPSLDRKGVWTCPVEPAA